MTDKAVVPQAPLISQETIDEVNWHCENRTPIAAQAELRPRPTEKTYRFEVEVFNDVLRSDEAEIPLPGEPDEVDLLHEVSCAVGKFYPKHSTSARFAASLSLPEPPPDLQIYELERKVRAADAVMAAIDRAVDGGHLNSRSEIADRRLDYGNPNPREVRSVGEDRLSAEQWLYKNYDFMPMVGWLLKGTNVSITVPSMLEAYALARSRSKK